MKGGIEYKEALTIPVKRQVYPLMNKQVLFLLFCAALAAFSLCFVSAFSGGNTFYIGAYRPVVEKSEQMRKEAEAAALAKNGDDAMKASNQPRPIGFREDEMQKKAGKRYWTY
jgi:hypothetical protein